jgi:hypothetical protein
MKLISPAQVSALSLRPERRDSRLRRGSRAALIVFLVTAITGGTAACSGDQSDRDQAARRPTDGIRTLNPDFSVPTSSSPSPVRATIPGTSIKALTAWWTQQWKTPFQQLPKNPAVYQAVVEKDGKNQYVIAAVQARDNRTDEPYVIICDIARDKVVVDQALLHKIVETCLAPVLQGDEQQEVPAWLYAQNFSTDLDAVQDFPRFKATIFYRVPDALSVRLRAKK